MQIVSPSAITISPFPSDEQHASAEIVAHADALCDRVTEAAPGDAITYHIGFLARDRYKIISKLPEDQRVELDALADFAMRLTEAGWVHLLQRRIGTECFAYLMVVRPRPRQQRQRKPTVLLPIQRRLAAA